MKVFISPDWPDGWIIDRLTDRMMREMPDIEWVKGYHMQRQTEDMIEEADGCDLIHFQNWSAANHFRNIFKAGIPVLMSIRSHRYGAGVRKATEQCHVHVISRALQEEFPGSTYIPDPLMIEPQPLIVGFIGKTSEYKGYPLIEAACHQIGAVLQVAENLLPEQMRGFYRFSDVIICASENEGFGTIVMEALALNRPVVSTRCGTAWEAQLPGVTWVDRTVEGIAEGLSKHWTSRDLIAYSWPEVCRQIRDLYRHVIDAGQRRAA